MFDFKKSARDRRLRAFIFMRDGYRCVHCGDGMVPGAAGDGSIAPPTIAGSILTIDHISPAYYCGTNDRWNL